MLQSIFKLEKNEIKPAGMVFLITFLWGTSQMFSFTAANAIFLNVYGASFLSFTFIFNAVLIPLTGIAVMKASEKFSFRKYFTGTLVFFVLSLSFFFILLSFTKLKWPAMTYLLWLDIEFTVSNVLFMALLNKLFNIRQSKRVFGPAGLGTDLSYIIMGFIISLLVNITGVLNLTLFAIVFDFISIFVFFRIYYSFPEKIGKTGIVIKEGAESDGRTRSKDLFKKKFVLLIIALGSIFTVCLCFGTNLYLEQTQEFLKDENKIASFIALFYSISSIILLFVKGFFTSRFIKSFGMTASLLLTPVLIGISALVFIALLKFPISPVLIFMLAVTIYLTQTVFGTSIHKSSYFSLIQSLPGNEINKVINLSETIVPNLVNGLAGVILLVMMRVFKAGSRELGVAILIITVIWLLIAFLLGKEYKRNLRDILKNKFDPDTEISLGDPEILKSVISGLKSGYPQEVIYSMEMLEKAEFSDLKSKVKELVYSGNPPVRRKALEIFEKDGTPDDLSFLTDCLKEEKEPDNISVLLNAIANSSEGGEIEMIENYLHHENKTISMGAFTALIRYCGIEGIMKAGSELLNIAKSLYSHERRFAAEIIGNIGHPNLYKLLIPLMSDDDMDVREKAFEASGKIRNPKLVPFMFKNLNNAALRPIVMKNLINFSVIAFPALEEIYRTDPASRKLIAYLYGRIKGEEAVRILCRKLKENDRDVLTEILNSLELCNFKPDREDLEEFENILDDMVGFGVLLSFALKDLSRPDSPDIITDALNNEIRKNKSRIFSLIFILHPDSNIKDIRFNYFFGQTEEKKALAIELLDNILPKKHKVPIMHLLEDSGTLPDLIVRRYPHGPAGYQQRLDEIIREKDTWRNVWLRSLVYSSKMKKLNGESEREKLLEELIKNENPQVAELFLPHKDSGLPLTEIVLFIRKSGIFQGIEDESLVEIAKCMDIIKYPENSRIFNKNDEGTQLYIIEKGRIRIHDGTRTIAELKSGEIFGELAAFSPEKRSADSTALSNTTLFSISQSDLFGIIDGKIEVAMDIIGILCARLRQTLAEGVYKPVRRAENRPLESAALLPVSAENKKLTDIEKMMVLKTVNIFAHIQDNILDDLAILAKEQFLSSRQILFRKGDAGTSMYVIVNGELKVHEGGKTIAVLKDREIIGELAALSSESRTATVTAMKDTLLLKLTQESIYEIMWDQRETAKEFIKVLAERLRNMM